MYNRERILSEIIKEPHLTIRELPLTTKEYANLLFPGKLYGNSYLYDSDAHKQLMNQLASHFQQKGADFIHKAGIAFALNCATKKELFTAPEQHYDAIEYSLRRICNLPIEILSKVIGVGFTGMVFDFDKQNIVKIAFNKLKNKEVEFWKYQINHSHCFFPKISYVENDLVIMERLITKSKKLDEYKYFIEKYVQINFLQEISFRTLNTQVEDLPTDFRNFVTNVRKTMLDAFDISCIGDLKIDNLGERANTGEIVMLDPIGGFLDNYSRITNYYQANMKHIQFS